MTKKQIKHLAMESYANKELDYENVQRITDFLKKRELKLYVKELKNLERRKTVFVTLPYLLNNEDQKMIQESFQDKRIIYVIDKTLRVGIRIVENDLITELNFKDLLGNLINSIVKSYD